MDPLTQAALGAAAAHAAFGRRLGWRAAAVGGLAGAAADADFLLRGLADPALPVAYHRHFTHSLAFVPVGGLLAAAPFMRDAARRAATAGAAVLAYATHPLLDACTSYGTVLFWPLTDRRVAWDVISIVDPVFTLLLVAGLVAALWRGAAWPSRAALALAALYLGLGAVQHDRALAAQSRLAASRGHAVTEGRAMPTLGNLVVWRSVYRAGDALHADAVRVVPFGSVGVVDGASARRASVADLPPGASEDARVRRVFHGFRWFAGGLVAVASDDPLVVIDARYSLETGGFEPLWGIEVRSGPGGPDVRWRNLFGDRDGAARRLLDEILGVGARAPRPVSRARPGPRAPGPAGP